MNLTVSGIVGGVSDTIALWICVCADDWAAELAVKASNEKCIKHLGNRLLYLGLE